MTRKKAGTRDRGEEFPLAALCLVTFSEFALKEDSLFVPGAFSTRASSHFIFADKCSYITFAVTVFIIHSVLATRKQFSGLPYLDHLQNCGN